MGGQVAVKGALMSGASSARAWRPDEVRRKAFTVRFRGLDHNEVRGFLNALADELARLYDQITTLTVDNGRLRGELQQAEGALQHAQGELQRAQVDPQEQVTDQAVLLLNQAQQLADALIDEGMQSARDLLLAARHQQRDIIEPGREADHGVVVEAMSTAEHVLRSHAPASSDVDDVRMFAKVAQVQFRAVLDALDEQVNRLGQFSETAERPRPADEEWLPSASPRRSELNPRTLR
jgi:DivIVA domain-containing protein